MDGKKKDVTISPFVDCRDISLQDMAVFSVEFCKKKVALYSEALDRVLMGQSYTIGGRSLSRVNHDEILEGLKYWQGQLGIAEASSANGRKRIGMRRSIPHD